MFCENIIVEWGCMKWVFAAWVLYELGKQNIKFQNNIWLSASSWSVYFFASWEIEDMKDIWINKLSNNKFVKKLNYNLEYLIYDLFKDNYSLKEKVLLSEYNIMTKVSSKNLPFFVDLKKSNDFYEMLYASKSIPLLSSWKTILWQKFVDSYCSIFPKDKFNWRTLLVQNSTNNWSSIIWKVFWIKTSLLITIT